MKDATNVLNATLSSLNLPAALEDTSGIIFFVAPLRRIPLSNN